MDAMTKTERLFKGYQNLDLNLKVYLFEAKAETVLLNLC